MTYKYDDGGHEYNPFRELVRAQEFSPAIIYHRGDCYRLVDGKYVLCDDDDDLEEEF